MCLVISGSGPKASERMRAAQIALPFEKPALKATANIIVGEDFADRLEKAVERAQARKILKPPALDV